MVPLLLNVWLIDRQRRLQASKGKARRISADEDDDELLAAEVKATEAKKPVSKPAPAPSGKEAKSTTELWHYMPLKNSEGFFVPFKFDKVMYAPEESRGNTRFFPAAYPNAKGDGYFAIRFRSPFIHCGFGMQSRAFENKNGRQGLPKDRWVPDALG